MVNIFIIFFIGLAVFIAVINFIRRRPDSYRHYDTSNNSDFIFGGYEDTHHTHHSHNHEHFDHGSSYDFSHGDSGSCHSGDFGGGCDGG